MQDISQEEAQAVEKIKTACQAIAREMMVIQPAINRLASEPVRDGLFKTVYQLTAEVESIKKQVIRYQKGDDSRVL